MIPDPADNIWEHSQNVRDLYRRRAHGHGEMDCAAQCAELLAPLLPRFERPPRLLDAGCGSGYLWHSFNKRGLTLDYFGLDYSPSLIAMGQEVLPAYGLPAERLKCGAIEDLVAQPYDVVTLLNTLTFCPDFRRPLDRLMATGAKIFVIRDNFGPGTEIRWEIDGYLDEGYNHLKAYWNRWSEDDVIDFLAAQGFQVNQVGDNRTQGAVEMVVGKTYYWSWLVAVR